MMAGFSCGHSWFGPIPFCGYCDWRATAEGPCPRCEQMKHWHGRCLFGQERVPQEVSDADRR